MGLPRVLLLSGTEDFASVAFVTWTLLVSFLAVAADTDGFGGERFARTESAGAGGRLLGDEVVALLIGAVADQDATVEAHFTFFSFVCFGSAFLSRKMT
jgi:hypothetical protein